MVDIMGNKLMVLQLQQLLLQPQQQAQSPPDVFDDGGDNVDDDQAAAEEHLQRQRYDLIQARCEALDCKLATLRF